MHTLDWFVTTRRRRSLALRAGATAVLAVLLATVSAGAGSAAELEVTGGVTVNVTDHGAVGDGQTDDTAAIQRANDAVAAIGGGTVVFPPGDYQAMGVRHDSNVEFQGSEGATLRHPNGVSATPIIMGRTTRTTATIDAGSSRLTVASTKRFVPGAVVGIRAAGGVSKVQTTTLASAVTADAGELVPAQPGGWRVNVTNFLWIEDEIVSYTGMSGWRMLNLRRGLFGTTAADHPAGAPVSQAQGLNARVQSVGQGTIELDRPAVRGVTGADVWVGSVNMSIRGLTLDGNRKTEGTPNNTLPLRYELARWLTIEGNIVRNGDHGAMSLDQGTSDALIANNVLVDTGSAAESKGSAVWLFRGATRIVVRDNEIGGVSRDGITIDDRTEISSEWDASSEANIVQGNRIDIPPTLGNAAIFVAGSNRNEITGNDVRLTRRGISIARSTQGINPGDSEGNLVRDNVLSGHYWGLHVTGSYNTFERNAITSTARPIVNSGLGNTFVPPVPEPTPAPATLTEPTPDPTPSSDPTPVAPPSPTPASVPTPAPTSGKTRKKAPIQSPIPTSVASTSKGESKATAKTSPSDRRSASIGWRLGFDAFGPEPMRPR